MKKRNPIAKAVRKLRPKVVPDKKKTYKRGEFRKGELLMTDDHYVIAHHVGNLETMSDEMFRQALLVGANNKTDEKLLQALCLEAAHRLLLTII